MPVEAKGAPLSLRIASGSPCWRKSRRLHGRRAGVEQAVAAEQVAAEVIDHSEGIAVAPIAHAELPLEVHGPDLVGSRGTEGSGPRVLPTRAPTTGTHAAVAQEDVADRAAGRPSLVGMAG